MPPVSKRKQFEVLVGVLALVEEQRHVSVAEAAAKVGLSVDVLRTLLDQVLFLEFRDANDELVSEARAFLLDEQDVLHLTDEHWLRNLAAKPPTPPTALRLLVAGTVLRSLSDRTSRPLDAALSKLERLVAADVVVPVDRPAQLEMCERARREGRTLRIRYVKDAESTVSDREIEPWSVFSNWGKWYVHGVEHGYAIAKWFRVDRIVTAKLGDHRFVAPECDIPELFNLEEEARTVRVRVDRVALDALPTPNRIGPIIDTGDGRVDVEITVYGDRRLENLLLVLPAGTEVLSPDEYRELRRRSADALLATYR